MKFILVLLCFSLLCGCSKKEEVDYQVVPFLNMQQQIVLPFNTSVHVTINTNNQEKDEQKIQQYIEEYHELLDGYDNYEEVHNLKTINDYAGTNVPVSVNKELYNLIKESIHITKLSEGKYNTTIEPLYQLYKPLFSSLPMIKEDPTQEEIQQAKACVVPYTDIDEVIELDDAGQTITIHSYDSCDKPQISLGAIGKGYATDQLKEKMKDVEMSIDMGSSTIYSNYKQLKVGIRSPLDSSTYAYPIQLDIHKALSTSGDDQNYYLVEQDGKQIRRSHIIDATLGYSLNYYRNVTVITDNNMLADALSTIFFLCKDTDEIKKYATIFEEEYDTQISYSLLKETEDSKLQLIVNDTMKPYILDQYLSEEITEVTYAQ